MTPEQKTAEETAETWRLFESSFTEKELTFLLNQAGVVPAQRHKEKIAQALIVWYHGGTPNNVALDRLRDGIIVQIALKKY